jgi:hypothetical protein
VGGALFTGKRKVSLMAPATLLAKAFIILAVLQTTSIDEVKAICMCAEVFAATTDLSSNNANFTGPTNGELRIYTSMRFYCRTTLTTMAYIGQNETCLSSNVTSHQNEYPQFQLWRRNGTIYQMEKAMELTTFTGAVTTISLGWEVQEHYIVGLWLPSGCYNGWRLRVGQMNGRMVKHYRLEGNHHDQFNHSDHSLDSLEDGLMPLITVETEIDFDCKLNSIKIL